MPDDSQKLSVIITGATGMVGEGALLECLDHPAVERVLLVSRRPYGITHPKVKECLIPDFAKPEGHDGELSGYNACFFCAGVSSVGMSEADYTRITYDTTIAFAEKLVSLNPQMTFIYVSGTGTDSTEKSSIMWARVKGRTENALTRIGFKSAYNFRPGFMKPTSGQHNVKWFYGLFYWPLRLIVPSRISTMRQVGLAMIKAAAQGYPTQVLEVKDINSLGSS